MKTAVNYKVHVNPYKRLGFDRNKLDDINAAGLTVVKRI